MKRNQRLAVLTLAAIMLAGLASADGWAEFESAKGYTLYYDTGIFTAYAGGGGTQSDVFRASSGAVLEVAVVQGTSHDIGQDVQRGLASDGYAVKGGDALLTALDSVTIYGEKAGSERIVCTVNAGEALYVITATFAPGEPGTLLQMIETFSLGVRGNG